ncbi:hypothetical protein Tco_0888467 [Tanacetum coccineum]
MHRHHRTNVSGPEEPEQAPLSPDYVPGPEYPEYLAPSDEEVPVKDQPYAVADSPIALSLGYVADSDPEEDPEEDSEDGPVDYPADGGDGDDEESQSSLLAFVTLLPIRNHSPSSFLPLMHSSLSRDSLLVLLTSHFCSTTSNHPLSSMIPSPCITLPCPHHSDFLS